MPQRLAPTKVISRDALDNAKNAYDQAQVGLNEATIDSAVSPLGHTDRTNGVRDLPL